MLVNAQKVTLVRDRRRILDEVSFSIEPGSVQVLIGPNGAGKTSLLRCMIGYVTDFQGHMHIQDRDIRAIAPRQRAQLMGYVPQSLDMDFNLDVRGFMECARFARDAQPDRKAIDRCLDMTETTSFANAYLDELSGGERQRVMIAAALAQEPKLLLLDEPNAHLDPRHQSDLVSLLERLVEDNMTLIIVAHDWNPFLHLNPTFLALKSGKLFHQGQWQSLHPKLESLYDCPFEHWQLENRTRAFPRLNRT